MENGREAAMQKKGQDKRLSFRQKAMQDCDYYRVPKENGKGFRVVALYRGLLYTPALPKGKLLVYNLCFSALVLLSAVLFAVLCTQRGAFNRLVPLALAEGAAMVTLCYAVVIWLIRLTSEREMRANIYGLVHDKLILALKATFGLFLFCTVLVMGHTVFTGFQDAADGLWGTLAFLAASGIQFLLFRMEEKLPFSSRVSREQPPAGAEKLDWDEKKMV